MVVRSSLARAPVLVRGHGAVGADVVVDLVVVVRRAGAVRAVHVVRRAVERARIMVSVGGAGALVGVAGEQAGALRVDQSQARRGIARRSE